MNESNALLAEQIQQNDQRAFAKLVGRHQSLVFKVCLRILGHRQDAEDVTQETFSRVAKYLHRWDSRRPLEPWLVAIAGNRCRTFLAKRRVHQRLSPAIEPATDQLIAEQAADILREEVDLALAQIPACQCRAFRLFHEQSMSYAEIARQMSCPVGTAKTWVHRARAQVMQQLKQRDVVSGPRETGRAAPHQLPGLTRPEPTALAAGVEGGVDQSSGSDPSTCGSRKKTDSSGHPLPFGAGGGT
jgi:RNA polymerase sigma-70 factor, ECF subfamily